MLPRDVDEAARDRHTKFWTGDVYKVVTVLRKYRPDLTVLEIDTAPTGVAVVFGADPQNTVLKDAYDDIIKEYVTPDPQPVPEEVLVRKNAVQPEALLSADFWPALVRARNLRRPRAGFEKVRGQIAALGG